MLGLYQYRGYKSSAESGRTLRRIDMVTARDSDLDAARDCANRGRTVADAACLARDLVNAPGQLLYAGRPGRGGGRPSWPAG